VVLLLSVVTNCTMSGVTPDTSQTGKNVQIMREDTAFKTAYTSRGPIFIQSDSDFSTYGFPGTGDENTPYLIEGYSITDSIYELIVIENTEAFFVIQNNYLDSVTASLDSIYIRNAKNGRVHANIAVNNRHGIFLDAGCQGINITHNVIEDSSESGIRVNSSTQITVYYNEVFDNSYNGIWANFSTDLNIRNNTIYDDELGVWLENTNSSTVFGNAIYGNDNAIWISNQSSSNDISFNRIFDPQGLNPNTCGIHLSHGAHLNQILNNTVSNSTEHGFYVEATSGNNTIKWNSFIGNNVGGSSQGFDAVSINVLYNYWSDWTTPDDDFDQIVDIPYPLEGAAMNDDPFPLAQPANPPVFHYITPLTVIYPNGGEEITTSVVIQWSTCYDSEGHAINYSVYFSHNSGHDWEKLVGNLTTTSYEWDTTSELATTHYLIQVVAECSDGLKVLDLSDGEFTLVAHTLSAFTITSPADTGPFDASLTIEWDTVEDSWGWSVSYSIQYSSSGGYSWSDLAFGLTDTTYQWDISQLEEDDTYLIKVVASADGGVTSEATSVLFSIQHEPTTTTPTEGMNMGLVLTGFGIAGAVVVVILVVLLKKRSPGVSGE
jgi:parallel beta-helix repeat protein